MSDTAAELRALLIRIRGRVQGVGFRPFLARQAQALGLCGHVRNTLDGVVMLAQGPVEQLERLQQRLKDEPPPAACVRSIETQAVALDGSLHSFEILQSAGGDSTSVELAPDLAVCEACWGEFCDPASRRHVYALNACTNCGPRYTMQETVPFDRARTSMRRFEPCPLCEAEYRNPNDRRYHAQNVTCPVCGPKLRLDENSNTAIQESVNRDTEMLQGAATLIALGRIVAVQGVGGFHLLCDATNESAVLRLRERKRRPRKPLAVLFADARQAERYALIDAMSRTELTSQAAPILLLPARHGTDLAPSVAPDLRSIGVLNAYTPMHRAIAEIVKRPLVATSANASDEPMPIAAAEAQATLSGTADAFLLHDRPILRPADDSVLRIIHDRPVPLRLGRGLAPLRLEMPRCLPPLLGTGGHLKAALAVSRGREIWLGPHLGDLRTPAMRLRYRVALADFTRLLGLEPELIAHDLHPDYFTTMLAQEYGIRTVGIQHHHAHVAACLAEHGGVAGPVLGISWDGTGYGLDGTIWGGEFLLVEGEHCTRVGSLWPFPLIGGDRAAREPRRSALGVCHAAGEPLDLRPFDERERPLIDAALRSPSATTRCTSAGRLFDAWSSLLGVCQRSSYEGEAALRLEELADSAVDSSFEIRIEESNGLPRLDWRPWVSATRAGLSQGVDPSHLAARFQESLARGSLEMARRVGVGTVVLTGGCFQNRRLSERHEDLLSQAGFRVLVHEMVPPGDGGLAVGQIWAAAQLLG